MAFDKTPQHRVSHRLCRWRRGETASTTHTRREPVMDKQIEYRTGDAADAPGGRGSRRDRAQRGDQRLRGLRAVGPGGGLLTSFRTGSRQTGFLLRQAANPLPNASERGPSARRSKREKKPTGQALRLWSAMAERGPRPDAISCGAAISACGRGSRDARTGADSDGDLDLDLGLDLDPDLDLGQRKRGDRF
jgi:hypothetical protein